MIVWVGPRTNYICDEDGSLTGTGSKTYVTPYYRHYKDVPGCTRDSSPIYNDSAVCTGGIDLRGYLFRNAVPLDNFKTIPIKIFHMNNVDYNTTTNASDTDFGWIMPQMIKNPEKDALFSHAAILPTDQVFNIHFKEGVDWNHLLIQPSFYTYPTEKTTILRFNYTE